MTPKLAIIDEAAIEGAFGGTIAGRGLDYYQRGKVIDAMKMDGTLYAEVEGSAFHPYSVRVDLKTMISKCSCPYSSMCKHGGAALYFLLNGDEVMDGNSVLGGLRKEKKEELVKLIERLIQLDPSLIRAIAAHKDEKNGGNTGGKDIKRIIDEFGWSVSSNFTNFAAQQNDIDRLDEAITESVLGLPPGNKKAELIVLFLESITEHFNDVDDSNGSLGELTDECIETLAKELGGLDSDTRADITRRLKKLEEDEYGYFDSITDVLEGVGK